MLFIFSCSLFHKTPEDDTDRLLRATHSCDKDNGEACYDAGCFMKGFLKNVLKQNFIIEKPVITPL